MELLRIIAMSMILIHHFMLKGLTPEGMPSHLYNFLNGFVYVGVPVFFLISGYFTIKYTFKGLIKLNILILLYGVVNLLFLYFSGVEIGMGMVKSSLLYPITGSSYWFMKVYMFLYITAPILNAGLRNLERKRLRNTLIILIIASFYGHHFYAVDSYLHGVYLYCVGYYIGKYKPYSQIKTWGWFAAFIAIMFVSGCLDWTLTVLGHENTYFQSYRNMFVFGGGLMLLFAFRDLKLTSNVVNSIAASSLGCYLLQDGNFGRIFLYPYQNDILQQNGYGFSLIARYAVIFFLIWGGTYFKSCHIECQ